MGKLRFGEKEAEEKCQTTNASQEFRFHSNCNGKNFKKDCNGETIEDVHQGCYRFMLLESISGP